jgi:hypothetical protein
MAEMEYDNIVDNLRDIDKNGTLLDILLEFEHVLDDQGMYAYKNWKLGEVVEGPALSRYWLFVKLMYPYKKMPDPKAMMRLHKIGCEVEFNKAVYKTPVDVESPEDLDENGKPKLKSHDVWLIDIWMPRKFVDEFTDDKIKVGDDEVDTEELNQAYDGGLDDQSNVEQQEV